MLSCHPSWRGEQVAKVGRSFMWTFLTISRARCGRLVLSLARLRETDRSRRRSKYPTSELRREGGGLISQCDQAAQLIEKQTANLLFVGAIPTGASGKWL